MKILGYTCIFGAVWNFVLPLTIPFEKSPLNLPESYPFAALISLSIVGILFLISSRGIRQKAQWGVQVARISIILAIGIMILFGVVFIFLLKDFLPEDTTFRIISAIIFTLVFGQFLILAFFGLQYLGRLPVKETDISEIRFGIENQVDGKVSETKSFSSGQKQTYKDALFPFGIEGTFALLVGGLLIIVFNVEKYLGESTSTVIIMAGVAFVFFGPIIYNILPSPFEKNKQSIASYTGGGTVLLFGGSWPFFRLIVYEDGLEVRVMFHRFFIPYEHMEDIPEKVGFFSRGILIKSNLPGVPSGIRFMALGMKKAVQTIIKAKTDAELFRKTHENPQNL
jgi:hypothetical protein